jgi:AcrR family transcriptional regulator
MTSQRVDVGAIRRGEIVEAASAIIAEEGIQNLSLSAIESRTGMRRGQLTYYFRTKEDILLAVFDRMLQMLRERAQASLRESDGNPCRPGATGWERIQHFLSRFILDPPESRVFAALQYTFLAQLGHRDDFRTRLANLYEEWRTHMARDLSDEVCRWLGPDRVSPRTLATFIQAVLHGLAMQRAVEPAVYDRQEMLDLLLTMLGPPPQPTGPSTRYDENLPSFPQVNHE